ncbi:MAG: hypothetical protein F4X12_20055 [Acidobacteriia bacterium]|nr:hypothetical protein [Terriglobia bacterium]
MAVCLGQEAAAPEVEERPEDALATTARAAEASEEDEAAQAGDADTGERTRLNLLGEVDSESGEARRNENVRLTLIDNNVLKELLRRMGATATILENFAAEQSFFGLEYGGSPKPSLHLRNAPQNQIRGELFWSHQNSALSARSFFQVGEVQPARTNDYGLNVGVPLGKRTALTLQMSQRRLLGQVNGNVLVPAADERVPITTDPDKLSLIQRVIGAYPDELPNRTDINARALNTNAPQKIHNDRVSAVLDNSLGGSRLTLRYNVTLQHVEAFQLVGGQNPDTTTKNHNARVTWNRAWSPYTTMDVTAGFERIGSLLVPEETSLGPFFLFSRILQSIGPGGNIPIDRVQNLFRYGARLARNAGNHNIVVGVEALQKQVNGFESNNHRGTFSFRADFGRNAVENLLAGTPSQYRFAIGNAHRGFRNYSVLTYLQDSWKVTPEFTLQLGLRYEPVASPTEVNALSEIPYDGDWNNFAPSLGFAYRPDGRWGVVRGAYGLHYGQLFNATFMQSRFNTPGVLSVVVNAPDLLDPLREFSPADLDPTARSAHFQLDPELSTPYSHQYNLSWAFEPRPDWTLDIGYVGSRSHRLLNQRYANRAHPVAGVAQVTRTINQRRPDPRYFDVLHTLNGSIGYFDAAKVSLRVPNWAGLNLDASYWWSKAIDLGSDYTNTATGRDGRRARSPTEFDVWGYMKGVSDYHQPHATLVRLSYAIPGRYRFPPVLRSIFGSWQLSSVVLWKSGTPFGIRSGSDSPGIGNVDGAGSDRPNVIDASILGRAVNHPDRSKALLPTSAFEFIQPTDAGGDLGRNTFRKDSVWNINMALSRRVLLDQKRSLLFRAESLNALNHPQFEEPDINLASRTFGAITNTLNDGRTFRFTLRIEF